VEQTSSTAAAVVEDAQGAADAETDRYLTFLLGEESFALPIVDVTEIMEYRRPTPVPMVPDHVRGVINVRGQVVPVVDLAARLGIGTAQVGRRSSIIIIEASRLHTPDGGEAQDIGILVDSVNAVIQLGAEDIEPPPAFGASVSTEYIKGMVKQDNDFMILLDIRTTLSPEQLRTPTPVA
jgi:purine-binding chemotaxis protein CheW